MEKKISETMLGEHGKIDQMLKELESCKDCESDELYVLFNKFKWNVEKHFFVEEKAIFSLLDKTKGEEVADTFDLMQEHRKIIEQIKEIEDNLNENPDLSELKKGLKKHSEFEDQTFYPSLDRTLNDQQKTEIIERAKEIIRG
jgi:iron-sulfur cluster repair protein YtfE (RIC family)